MRPIFSTTRSAPTTLVLSASQRGELAERAAAGHPHEVCGLLIGRTGDGRVETVRVTSARNLNVERAHDRFELDPADWLAADKGARAEGLEIVGIWHTHPDHPAEPSATDLEAAWEGYSYLIIGTTAAGAAELRSWRLVGDLFVEEAIHPSGLEN